MTERRLGLRARVIAAFAIGALLMSSLLSIVTYSVTRAQLTESREKDAFVSAENTAVLINNALSSTTEISGLVPIMSQVLVPTGTLQGMLHNTTSAFVDSQLSINKLDPVFVNTLRAGSAAEMTFRINAQPYYVVGLPLPRAQANAWYLHAAPLAEVEQDLNSLLPTLAGASVITTVLGMAFGVYVTKRLLSPIDEISEAAGLVDSSPVVIQISTSSSSRLTAWPALCKNASSETHVSPVM